MKGKLTRRKFIKILSAGSALVVYPGFQPDCNTFASCDNCGIHGEKLVSPTFFRLLKKRYCPNCGIDLYFNKYPVGKKCTCNASVVLEKIEKQNRPPCYLVPFPNIELAGNTNKPVFRVADFKF